jgi:hypothetical protein
MLMRYSKDARGNYANTIKSADNFRNIAKRDTLSRALIESITGIDAVISSLLDCHSYLSSFIETGTYYYVDREGKSVLDPWVMFITKTIFDQRRSVISSVTPLPMDSSLYMRSYNIILNHAPIFSDNSQLDCEVHLAPPPPSMGKEIVLMRYPNTGGGITATSHASFKRRVETIKNAEANIELVLPTPDLRVLHMFSADNPYPPLMMKIEDIEGEIGSANIKNLIPYKAASPSFYKNSKLPKEVCIAMTDFLLRSGRCERLLFSSYEELAETLVLPESLLQATELYSKGGQSFSRQDQKELADLGLNMKLFNELYKDHYALIRLPGRIMIMSKEPVIEVAFKNPSNSTSGRLELVYGPYPLLVTTSTRAATLEARTIEKHSETENADDESIHQKLDDIKTMLKEKEDNTPPPKKKEEEEDKEKEKEEDAK